MNFKLAYFLWNNGRDYVKIVNYELVGNFILTKHLRSGFKLVNSFNRYKKINQNKYNG